jgi:O-antigen ligase
MPVVLLLLLAWGAFAFGAVYEWAYTPLFWAAAGVGSLGWVLPGSADKARAQWPLVAAVALFAAAAGLQLLPLTPGQISRVSPATDRFLARYDVGYAQVKTAPDETTKTIKTGYRHPLSIDPRGTRLGLTAFAALALLSTGVARSLDRRRLRALAFGLVILGGVLAFVGIAQSGLDARGVQGTGLVYGFWKPQGRTNPFGPFVNRNHFAGWMLLGLPIAIGYFYALVERGMRGVRAEWRERVLWFSSADASRAVLVGTAILLMCLSLLLTLSRSGIAGFLLAVTAGAVVVTRRQAHRAKRTVALGFTAVVVSLSLWFVGFDAFARRFAESETHYLAGRLPIWADAVNVLREFPLVGTGLNTYGTAMLLLQEHDLETRAVEAHNDYLQLAAEGGVLLAIPAALLAFVLIREIRRRFRERADDPMEYWLRVGAVTGLSAMALQETMEFSLQMPGIAALAAVAAAIAVRPGGGTNVMAVQRV